MSLVYSAPRIPGATRSNCLYLGGKAEAKDEKLLRKLGITHILNVTPEKEVNVKAGVPNYFEKSFNYRRIAVYDSATTDLLVHADAAVAYISTSLYHGSVLVHCHHGKSRSTTIVAFFLMRKAGMSMDRAMRLLKSRRPQIEPIPAFLDQLRQYEQRCLNMGAIKVTTGIQNTTTACKQLVTRPMPEPNQNNTQITSEQIGTEYPGPDAPEIKSKPKESDSCYIVGPARQSFGKRSMDADKADRSVDTDEHIQEIKRRKN